MFFSIKIKIKKMQNIKKVQFLKKSKFVLFNLSHASQFRPIWQYKHLPFVMAIALQRNKRLLRLRFQKNFWQNGRKLFSCLTLILISKHMEYLFISILRGSFKFVFICHFFQAIIIFILIISIFRWVSKK